MRFKHVAIEGTIGVGKTTLATALAAHWGARLVLEQPADNPFLERYYRAMDAHGAAVRPSAEPDTRHDWRGNPLALQTQLNFLFQRIEQLSVLQQPGMFEQGIVSDFMFAKDAIFAALTLGDDELALYRPIYRRHADRAAQPDLVIWLHAEPDTLLTRVRRRARGMEHAITEEYLAALSEAYQRYFSTPHSVTPHSATQASAPVLAVNTEAFHPAADAPDGDNFQRLLDRIERFQGPFEYFDPPDPAGRHSGFAPG